MNRRDRLHQEFREDLVAAQTCSERAYNALSAEFAPIRGVVYRWRLKRAQKALKKLVKYETQRKVDL